MNSAIGVLFLVSTVFAQSQFALLDTNGDGFLDRGELRQEETPDQQWNIMLNLLDKDADGQITLMEYEKYANEQGGNQGNKEAQIETSLRGMDLNRDGFLDQSELPGNIQADAWKAMLAAGDTDKDGKISIEEYEAVVKSQGAEKPAEGEGEDGGTGGASSLTVTTVWLGLVSTMWLFW